MRRLNKYICVLFLLLVAVGAARAQTNYFCDFEDANERQQWTLNPRKSTLTDADFDQLWYIGEPGHCGPLVGNGVINNGLYISSDGGNKVCYKGSKGSYVTAYRDLTLPAGQYTVRFDWLMQGKSADEVKVVWADQTNKCNSAPNTAALPTFTSAELVSRGTQLRGSSSWKQYSTTFTVPANRQNGRLVFYFWTASGGAANPAAAIDNIEIIPTASANCSKPTKVTYDAKTGKLSWQGTGTNFDVRYYSYQAGTWYETNNYQGKSLTLTLQEEGYFYFYVRQVCDSANNIHSDWVMTSAFVFIPGSRCIEYMDLGAGGSQATGQCYTSDFATYTQTPNQNGTPATPSNPSDCQDIYATHVLHTDPNEIDNFTSDGGGLKTVPDGEIASVRLGARWTGSNYPSSRVVYTYRVQPGISDLMVLKYATVMENPSHGIQGNPRFTLEILDHGVPLDGCTQAEFRSGFGDTQAWHSEKNGENETLWSDWQTVTVSLRNYANHTLTIRLTAISCVADYHYSYVYFTMGCQSGDFEGLACGDFSIDQFVAPEGFNYRWHKASDPTQRVLGTDRIFNIDLMDTAVYTVDLISLIDPDCYYTLTANPNPRFPISNAHLLPSADSITVKDCQYHVKFSNDAYVALINRRDTSLHTRTSDPIDGVYWDFGDGSDVQFTKDTIVQHTYGPKGGRFWVKSFVSMSNGACLSDGADSVLVDLPALDEPGYNRLVMGCDGVPVEWNHKLYYKDTILYEPRKLLNDCVIDDTIRIVFSSTFRDTTYQAICEHTSFTFEGKDFSTEGLDSVNVATESGCDSVRYLNLHIIPDVRFAMEALAPFCDDQATFAIPVTVNTGKYAGAALVPDARAVAAGFKPRYEYPMEEPYSELAQPLDTVYEIPVDTFIRPGFYTFQLQSLYRECPVDPVPFQFTLYYSSKVLYQKDGYIVLYNPEYNYGGYEFSSYRWFRDGMPLSDTKSYIQPTDSDYQHIYQVELIPAGDSIGVMSCPMEYTGQFTPHKPMRNIRSSVSPSVVRTGEPLYVAGEGDARIYDALGRLVMTAPVNSENPVTIPAPQRGGMYVVLIQNDAYRVLVH